ncbi:tyrosine-protein phosphatase [Ligilactobacillus aviarius]|uniref:Tyrosine-protein phosphatase n=1 Tax=Ligilactobacillus aviarius TaxID=1606 RepID=A0A179CA08_9LACO|nr:CpsB/CapC family capsule biosynthesis tyrosine phosphatase [Ligilactobacillus aviarius]OAP97661.1 tyrosine protein phosphatase [Ligilactobacillus aviarius]OAQ00342.1 tyrosine protein phosphatase [Ligilactobacillus aviarius]OAQ01958.1 tyrosine protein phosphatase [Ligilactobacillus aviarius]OAQ03862.1 tyrosine protein phosphatase [Ligilactobacillus aviarius]OAQ06550.1 tyrosine protein phosphatase [Ligilactobacillus aviarius]
MTLVDLHSHILPGVDDGSPDLETSLELARESVADGVTHMLLTPHHMDSNYVNHKRDVIEKTKAFQQILDREQIPLKVFPGQEVHLTEHLIEAIDHDDILYADADNRYIMLELPHTHVPEYFMRNIFPELQTRGITPVIVHPERNQGIQRDHQLLYDMVKAGCLTQLTANSYLDTFGEQVTQLTQEIIDANLGSTFSSDVHAYKGRRSRMNAAYQKLVDNDRDKAVTYTENAKAILNGEDVPMPGIQEIRTKKKSFWDKLFKSKK